MKQDKNNLLKLENEAVVKYKRLRILRSNYTQSITYYKLDSNVKVNQQVSFDFTTTRDYIFSSKWL